MTIYAKPDIIYAVGNIEASPQTVEQEAEKEYRINHNCTWDSQEGAGDQGVGLARGLRNHLGVLPYECRLLAMARWLDGSTNISHTRRGVAYMEHQHGCTPPYTNVGQVTHTMQMRSHKSVKVMAPQIWLRHFYTLSVGTIM